MKYKKEYTRPVGGAGVRYWFNRELEMSCVKDEVHGSDPKMSRQENSIAN